MSDPKQATISVMLWSMCALAGRGGGGELSTARLRKLHVEDDRRTSWVGKESWMASENEQGRICITFVIPFYFGMSGHHGADEA